MIRSFLILLNGIANSNVFNAIVYHVIIMQTYLLNCHLEVRGLLFKYVEMIVALKYCTSLVEIKIESSKFFRLENLFECFFRRT